MKPVTGFYLECNHLVAAITADRPCPTCAAIAQAVKEERDKAIKILNNMRPVVWKRGVGDAWVEKFNKSIDGAIEAILRADTAAKGEGG